MIQTKGYMTFLSYMPKVLLAFVIPVLDSIYNNIAIWLNDMGKFSFQMLAFIFFISESHIFVTLQQGFEFPSLL